MLCDPCGPAPEDVQLRRLHQGSRQGDGRASCTATAGADAILFADLQTVFFLFPLLICQQDVDRIPCILECCFVLPRLSRPDDAKVALLDGLMSFPQEEPHEVEGHRVEAGRLEEEQRCNGHTQNEGHVVSASSGAAVGGQARQQSGSCRGRRWQVLRSCRETLQEVVLPVAVAVLGVGFSVAALWVSLVAALWPKPSG